ETGIEAVVEMKAGLLIRGCPCGHRLTLSGLGQVAIAQSDYHSTTSPLSQRSSPIKVRILFEISGMRARDLQFCSVSPLKVINNHGADKKQKQVINTESCFRPGGARAGD